jgi:serine/threonine-protein kinase
MATVSLGKLVGPGGFSRTVAIKRPHAHLTGDSNLVKMFLDEARLAARIHHPNVVSTLDVVNGGGDLFLVMEYIEGLSVAALQTTLGKKGSVMPPAVALSIVQGTLLGLHAAHEARDEQDAFLNLIHRDVSPQNILVGVDGLTRVVDFGVAKADGRLQTTTDVAAQKGKLAYMAPERLAAHEVDRGDDLWSVAVVFWEMLTGRRLFDAPHTAMLVTQLLHDPIPVPSELGAPGEYDAFFRRALSRERSARFQDAPEMAAAIESVGGLAAPPQVVADWLKDEASKQLAQRAQLVTEMDGALSPRGAVMPIGSSAPVLRNDEDASAPTTPGLTRAVTSSLETPRVERRKSETESDNGTHAMARSLLWRASLFLFALATLAGVGITVFRSAYPRKASVQAAASAAPAVSVSLAPPISSVASPDPSTTAEPPASTAESAAVARSSAAGAPSHRPGQRGPARLGRPPQPTPSPAPAVPSDPMRLDSRR